METFLSIPDVLWRRDDENPAVAGRFAFAEPGGDGRVRLTRDPLGLNKLFYACHESRGVLAGNYVHDLVGAGAPFEAVYSVPAGSRVTLDPQRRTLTTERYFRLADFAPGERAEFDQRIARCREGLESTFAWLAERYAGARVVVCLSGGLDSSLIAATAARYFPGPMAYTYSYLDREDPAGPSADAQVARRTAAHLGLPFRMVEVGPSEVLDALPAALRYGQDFRDFNVHSAVVNVVLARAIAADGDGRPTVVLTGDLMNELFADYAAVSYRGRAYYELPDLPADLLRMVLLKGMQAGDREVGVFHAAGLEVVQPYAFFFDALLGVPSGIAKQDVIAAIAGDALPAEVYTRPKARAQIGDGEVVRGILPLLLDSDRDDRWLAAAFRAEMRVSAPEGLGDFIRSGVYRCAVRYPSKPCGLTGFLTAE
jgi:asparagine synthetase B (glutamine-hydrolysing)